MTAKKILVVFGVAAAVFVAAAIMYCINRKAEAGQMSATDGAATDTVHAMPVNSREPEALVAAESFGLPDFKLTKMSEQNEPAGSEPKKQLYKVIVVSDTLGNAVAKD